MQCSLNLKERIKYLLNLKTSVNEYSLNLKLGSNIPIDLENKDSLNLKAGSKMPIKSESLEINTHRIWIQGGKCSLT